MFVPLESGFVEDALGYTQVAEVVEEEKVRLSRDVLYGVQGTERLAGELLPVPL
jgi:hypothetical protein